MWITGQDLHSVAEIWKICPKLILILDIAMPNLFGPSPISAVQPFCNLAQKAVDHFANLLNGGYDDVMVWNSSPPYWPVFMGIQLSPVDFPRS